MASRTITKRELTLRIAEKLQLKHQLAQDMMQLLIEEITEELASGNRVELRDFSVFEARSRPPRYARNPKTGQRMEVPARMGVAIRAGKRMVDRVNEVAVARGLRPLNHQATGEDAA